MHVVKCVHPPRVALCNVPYSTVQSAIVQYLYFKLDLWEEGFTELSAVHHKEITNEDLMELEAQRKDEASQEEEEITEEWRD